MTNKRYLVGTSIAAGILLAPSVFITTQALADSGATTVVRKTVLVTASPDGTISTDRLIIQASASGTGVGQIVVPVGSATPRNLEGFAPTAMNGTNAVYDFSVSGSESDFRSVVDNTAPLPVSVSVAITLDGQSVTPDQVLGRSGLLQVTYTVKNLTTKPLSITYEGDNGPITEEVPISVPLGGAVDIDLPSGFSNISAPGANIAGDGSGGTKLSYSLVLFEPLGAPEGSVTYTAQVENASFPAAVLSFLPIIPMDNSTVASTYAAYQGGAESGLKISDAGVQIGDNLGKLASGAGQLLAGLGLLSDGAQQLSAGLNDTAVPGSAKLADGATALSEGMTGQLLPGSELLADGAQTLADGVNDELVPGTAALAAALKKQLYPGARELSAGLTKQLAPGAESLAAGVEQIAGGLAQLNDAATGLPALQAGIGTPTDTPADGTLYGGLNGVNGGLLALQAGLTTLQTGITSLEAVNTGALGVAGSLATLATTNCLANAECLTVTGTLAATIGTNTDVYPAQSTLYGLLNTMGGGLAQSSTGLATALAALGDSGTAGSTILYGMTASLTGLAQIQAGVASAVAGVSALAAGSVTASSGADELAAGAGDAADGAQLLAKGAHAAADGAIDIRAGANKVGDGADQVAGGASDLADGVATAADGAAQVADGADQLAAGLVDAGDGAAQLAAGLKLAAPGAAQLQDGANQLKDQGAVPLEQSGKTASTGFSRDLAIIDAVNTVALTGAGIPFGPSPGASTTTAVYQFQLGGISPSDKGAPLRWGLAVLLIVVAGGAGGLLWSKGHAR